MRIIAEELNFDKAVLNITASNGKKFTLTIEKTDYGHSYEDFDEWDITDREWDFLDGQVESYIEQMKMSL